MVGADVLVGRHQGAGECVFTGLPASVDEAKARRGMFIVGWEKRNLVFPSSVSYSCLFPMRRKIRHLGEGVLVA